MADGARNRRLRGLFLRGSSVCLGTLVALFLAEGATRLLAPRILSLSNPLVRFDPELGWLQQDGVLATRRNEAGEAVTLEGLPMGIRKPPRPHPSAEADTVLVVGDSVTAGNQVPYPRTWPAEAERLLRFHRPRAQVVNAGVDGYDLAQEFRLGDRLWGRFRPRVLVVGLYVGNDLVDYEREAQARPPWAPGGLAVWVTEHSYLYHFLRGSDFLSEQRTTTRRLPRAQVPFPEWDPRALPGLSDLTPEQQGRIRGQFASPELLPVLRGGEPAARRLETSERVLLAFAGLAAERCAGFVLVLLPTKQQVLPAQREAWQRLHGLSRDQVERPQRELRQWASRQGVAVVDATEALSRSERPEALFWPVDLHLSPAGHAAVAQAVAPAIDAAWKSPADCGR